jgi:hypothetical protein
VQTQFDRAFLLKPATAGPESDLIHQLAPLLFFESPAGASSSMNTPAQVFHHVSSVLIQGKPHAQFTYWWRAAAFPSDPRPSLTGVRLTLDANGLPAIWEELSGRGDVRVVYVAENLEAKATQEFGGPLAGRQFAVDRSLAETPRVVVARLLADAPMAMGPVVLLRTDGREIVNLSCRCMPTQARELVGHGEYQLTAAPVPAELTRQPHDLPLILRLPHIF